MELSRLTREGTAEPVSRDQILRHARGQGNIDFPCSADHERDWQPYPVDRYSAICDDHTYIQVPMRTNYITISTGSCRFREVPGWYDVVWLVFTFIGSKRSDCSSTR